MPPVPQWCSIDILSINFLAPSIEISLLCSKLLLKSHDSIFCFPQKIASMPHIIDILANWDIQETEKLISKNEAKKNERLKMEKDYRDKQTKL